MKPIFTCGIITLFLFSCQKSTVAPVSGHQPIMSHALKNSPNGAFTYNQQVDIDLAGTGSVQFNACNGDLLEIVSGSEHIDVQGSINQNKETVNQHLNIQSLKLVSLATGVEYVGSGSSNVTETFDVTGKMIITEGESVMLTTAGGKNNSVVKFDLHETIDPSGNITAFVDNARAGCQ